MPLPLPIIPEVAFISPRRQFIKVVFQLRLARSRPDNPHSTVKDLLGSPFADTFVQVLYSNNTPMRLSFQANVASWNDDKGNQGHSPNRLEAQLGKWARKPACHHLQLPKGANTKQLPINFKFHYFTYLALLP